MSIAVHHLTLLLLSATAAPSGTTTPVQRMLDCRLETESAARLACFDREAASVQTALERRELLVADREGVRQTQRRLFGLSLPRLPLLEGHDQEEVSGIDSTIAETGRNASGGYIFRLADGSRWTQTDDNQLALAPRKGEAVTVRRGALGSFLLKVGRQPGVKVRRLD